MAITMSVTNPQNEGAWTKSLTQDELDAVKDMCDSRKTIYVIPAAFFPVRTGHAKDFCQDLFLPTFFNQALKVKSIVGKFFAILTSLILDIATFPVRLLTALPWVLINKKNAKKENHPLHKYLKNEGADPKILAAEHVRVKFTEESVNKETNLQTTRWNESNVNFIPLSAHDDFDYENSGSSRPTPPPEDQDIDKTTDATSQNGQPQ